MIEWQPISEQALRARIAQGEARMGQAERRLWDAVRIEPVKWLQQPYGEAGGGFWVVGLIGNTVIWYNDLEDGFNRSRYTEHGIIADYWCNQDELELTLQYLLDAMTQGRDIVQLARTRPARVR